ncbi:MAG: hypothetical protein COT73_01080 [Bdellovibrio sp. CG10_big_fil_rev_8_21_14_0_10_47_8]|nr:MAG: hypothetical protein COT73_01080 [Bdellovibrio sp. CG10_big_fil_rev_8_21_14_0_10_47_8]
MAFQKIPRPVLVTAVLLVGVLLFFVIQKPETVCTPQIEIFKQSQAGALFPKVTEKSRAPATYARAVESCRIANSPGGCFELFNLLKKVVRDLRGAPQECLVPFGELAQVKNALRDGVQLMILLAWGDKPPDKGMEKFAWLEMSDLSLYCQLRDVYEKIYGTEGWSELRLTTYHLLPGEAAVFQDGTCLNCDYLKKADQTLSPEEIWARSLFSLRCERLR